jgi:protein transport protein SEC13
MQFDAGHSDMVHDAQFDYYGRRLATASSDKTIKVFDVIGDQHVHIADLRGHEGPVWQCSFSHPSFGSLLASCSFDHRIIVWKEQQDGQFHQVITLRLSLLASVNHAAHPSTGVHFSSHLALGISQ